AERTTKHSSVEVIRSIAQQIVCDETREGIGEHTEAATNDCFAIGGGLPVEPDPWHERDALVSEKSLVTVGLNKTTRKRCVIRNGGTGWDSGGCECNHLHTVLK